MASLGGVATRRDLLALCTPAAIDWAVSSGELVRLLPGTYVEPERAEDWHSRCAAALRHAGPDAALSDLSALRLWGLPAPERSAVDLLAPHRRGLRSRAEGPLPVEVERTRATFATRVRHDLQVVTLERAIIGAWPALRDDAQRAPAIVAVRRRRTTPARLLQELEEHPRLQGRRELHRLIGLLAIGCHSELEVWGHDRVFTDSRFQHLARQVPRTLDGRTVWLDTFDEEAMLDIELDGREYHDSPRDRERDIARDARLAEEGILTVRFPHRRLVHDPEGCREQVWRVRQVRLLQLGSG